MTINVYWSCIEREWMRAQEPEPILNTFYRSKLFDKNDSGLDMRSCGAFNDHMNNVFALKSMYSYEFFTSDNKVYSDMYDQAFFNRHVVIKSLQKNLYSFTQGYIFFTDVPSLKVTVSEYPYLEDNEVTKRCILLPGQLDIGKWYRSLDTMFYLKKDYDSFKISEGDIYSYLRFHTSEKINFIQYRQNDILNKYMFDSINAKSNKTTVYKINQYYKMFKTKDLILKEIKNNIVS